MHRVILLTIPLLFVASCAGGTSSGSRVRPSVSPVITATPGGSSVASMPSPMAQPTASSADQVYSVDFISKDIGWAAGSGGIFVTHDGGEHWEPQLSQPRQAVVDIDFLDVQTGFAIEPIPDVAGGSRSGGVDFLLTTSDGGQHWQVRVWTPYRFTHIAFVSATNGWAIGYKQVEDDPGTLFHTDDGGQTWTEVLSPAASVCFGDQKVGWAASLTEVKHTIDGGSTWTTSFTNPVQNEGNKVWEPTLRCAGQDVAWVLYADGVAAGSQAYAVFRTLDEGAHWEAVLQAPIGPPLGTHVSVGQSSGTLTVLDAANAWVVSTCGACGGNGTSSLEMTRDGGTTWEPPVEIAGAGAFPQRLDLVDHDHGWLASDNGIFATFDGGLTWVRQWPTPIPTTPSAPTASPRQACASFTAIKPGRADDAIVNADGDGLPDRLTTFTMPSSSGDTNDTLQLQLVLDGRTAISVQASQTTNVIVAPIGGYDVNGDGRDELFVVTGHGAYTTWIDIFEFVPATCALVRVANPDPRAVPPLFAVGASVGNGVGLECANGTLVSTTFTRISDEPLRYGGQRTSYRIVGTQLEVVDQTNVEFDPPGAAQVATFNCGTLRLPR